MSNYFKMLVFVVIICFFLGCSKNAELSLTQLLDRTISQEMPTLLFLSDTSSFRYRRVKEMLDNTAWRKIRNDYPCCDCIYQWLCPSPSNYELAIGKPNLCHVKP